MKVSFSVDVNLRYLRMGNVYYSVPSKNEVKRAYDDISRICRYRLKEKYGEWKYAKERLDAALEYLSLTESAFDFVVIKEICYLSKENGDPALWDGAGTILSYLLGMTDINPLIPHYYCHKCKYVEERREYRNGFDLPEKNCPHCGEPMDRVGHDFKEELVWVTYGGNLQRPDSQVDVSESVMKGLERWLNDRLGNAETNSLEYKNIRIYNYPRYDMLFYLENKTGVPREDIDVLDKKLWIQIENVKRQNMRDFTFYDLFRLRGTLLMEFCKPELSNQFCVLKDEVCDALVEQGYSSFNAAVTTMKWKPPKESNIILKTLPWHNLRRKVDLVSEIIVDLYCQWYKAHFPDAYEKAEWESRIKSELLYIKGSFFEWDWEQEREFMVVEGKENMLKTAYTFERFVIGKSNQIARTIAGKVSDFRIDVKQMVYIYGGTGLGKTHLLHAIGNHVLRCEPSRSVVYVSAENFAEEFIQALRSNHVHEFKTRYKQADILLFDNFQFFDGKDTLQEEVLHLFEARKRIGKSNVLASLVPPERFSNFNERLLSHLKSSIIVKLENPDFELRKKFLLERIDPSLRQKHPDLDTTLFWLATKIEDNIRFLEGTLNQIVQIADALEEPITIEFAKKVLRSDFKGE